MKLRIDFKNNRKKGGSSVVLRFLKWLHFSSSEGSRYTEPLTACLRGTNQGILNPRKPFSIQRFLEEPLDCVKIQQKGVILCVNRYEAASCAIAKTGFLFPPSLSNTNTPDPTESQRGVLAAEKYAAGAIAGLISSKR